MIRASQIGWGKYSSFEGPWYKGSKPFKEPENPTFNDKLAATITATEGGQWNAINMYDVCILTVGLIQWCDRHPQRSVTRILADCEKKNPDKLRGYLDRISPNLEVKSVGSDSFFYLRGERVDTEAEQKVIYLGGATGFKDQWTDGQKAYAKNVAAVMASIFEEDEFVQCQMDFTAPKLLSFATSFGPTPSSLFPVGFEEEGYEGALRALYISFAANMPAIAANVLKRTLPRLTNLGGEAKFVELAKALTFEPNIAIYPTRYNHIRPTIERLFGVDLPDFSAELKTWQDETGCKTMLTPKEVQETLLALGYDLGSSGADGRIGPKTMEAVKRFQETQGLTIDGIIGPKTMAALVKSWDSSGSCS